MLNQDSQISRLARGEANEKGWRPLTVEAGEELTGVTPEPGAKSVLSLVHISDLHICDAQSPARVEILDRFADPHNPYSQYVKYVGTYRAQEILTTQTLEAMVQTINSIKTGIVTDRPIDAVVITGDVTDNAQNNELSWYLSIMDGGLVHPDSGNLDRWEGVAATDPHDYDPSYWNPEGTPHGCAEDFPRALYGLPTVPGLLAAVRKPFQATGLVHQWFATHGNHDALLQGTVAADEYINNFATGDRRVTALDPDLDLVEMFGKFQMVGPTSYPDSSGSTFRYIAADQSRRINQAADWAKIHLECGHGHGLQTENAQAGTKYWSRDIGEVRLISMDTVNEHGGWQGSLGLTQFNWLKQELSDPAPKYFVLLSHHPADTLFNLYSPTGVESRIGEVELNELLLSEPRIILWLAGHNHEHHVDFIGAEGKRGFWHIQTASNIDWPQQGRIVEILESDSKIVIATSVFDHQSPVELEVAVSDLDNPVNLAGLSRLLSANDWQRRSGEFDVELMAGQQSDRNRYLWLESE